MEYYNNKTYSIYFDNPDELLNFEFKGGNKNSAAYIFTRKENGWFYPDVISGKQMIEKSIFGDEVAFEKYVKPKLDILGHSENFVENINFTNIKKRKRIKSNFGNEIDIHKVYQGNLDKAWDSTVIERSKQQRNFYYVVFDIGGLADVNVEESYWTAACATKIYQAITAHGQNCEVAVGNYSDDVTIDGDSLSWLVPVKKFDEHLSDSRLAMMANVGFFRSFGFLAKLTCTKTIRSSYGVTRNYAIDKLPLNIREAAVKGEIKPIIIKRSTSEAEAKRSYETFFEFMQKTIYQ